MRPFGYYNCKKAYHKHFNSSDSLVNNSHERLQSNDCLLRYSFEYQYVTNYDVDEVIIPRSKKFYRDLISYPSNNDSLNTRLDQPVNIYDYTASLAGMHDLFQVKKIFNFFIKLLTFFLENTCLNSHYSSFNMSCTFRINQA